MMPQSERKSPVLQGSVCQAVAPDQVQSKGLGFRIFESCSEGRGQRSYTGFIGDAVALHACGSKTNPAATFRMFSERGSF